MGLTFKKATKSAAKARIGLVGPSGSGKTWSALAIASGLGKRIALVDTERGSASLYADKFTFDVLELETHHPERYIEAFKAAEAAGYDVLICDSLSHAWMGRDGALELVDNAAKRSKSGNSFMAWRDVTPLHNALVDCMLQANMHVIATLRAKVEWLIEEGPGGKKTPRKIGLAAIQREGLDFEFTIVGDLDVDHNLVISKTRMSELAGKVVHNPGEDLGRSILAWLTDGAPAPITPPSPAKPSVAQDAHAEHARITAELTALQAFFGSRQKLLESAGMTEWPKKLKDARDLLQRALAAQERALVAQAEDAPFQLDEGTQLASSVRPPPDPQPVPEGEAASPPRPELRVVPPAGEKPEPQPTGIRLAVLSPSVFWSECRKLGAKDRATAETQTLFGSGPGQLSGELRGIYVELVKAGLDPNNVAQDLVDLLGAKLPCSDEVVWTGYLELVAERKATAQY